jgi:pyruvate-ferredoxin/flavodoxin oxidoreductase
VDAFVQALPPTVRSIAVLDRTKEAGASGDPLYLDVVNALQEAGKDRGKIAVRIVSGRYGLSSKEFAPGMAKAVFDNLKSNDPRSHFTIGIEDDVSHSSLNHDPEFSIEPDNVVRAVFYGLGADGTVGANKNSIKIIGENTDNFAQGYFVYDSKKSGAVTVSHLRFGPERIHAPYLISRANFVGCHQWIFLERLDILGSLAEHGTFLLNSPYGPEEVWQHLPASIQAELIRKKATFYVIDAYGVARATGLGSRMNTIMQACFFAISNVLPREEAIAAIKEAIRHTYGKKGEDIVSQNLKAVDESLSHLFEVTIPKAATGELTHVTSFDSDAPQFEREVLGTIYAGHGDGLPVSAFPCDGTFPTATAKWEKRNLALDIPVWDPKVCIQCGKCAMVCPHSVIRIKVYDSRELEGAPATSNPLPLAIKNGRD